MTPSLPRRDVHSCHTECPCQTGGQPHSDFTERLNEAADMLATGDAVRYALEPKLTRADLRVLRALPEWRSPWDDSYTPEHPISVWRLGETLREMDLADLYRTLRGLARLGYVMECGASSVRWMRTEKGDAEASSNATGNRGLRVDVE